MTGKEREKYLEAVKNFNSQEFQVFIADSLIRILEEVREIKHKM